MEIIILLNIISVFVFSISASLSAINRKFDMFGIVLISFVTSVGGGTVRDILLGNFPIAWLNDLSYPVTIFFGTMASFLFTKKLNKFKRTYFWFDTIALSTTTIIGIHKGLDVGINPFISVTLGLISAVFGGIIRDTLCNEVPLVFRKGIYASACIFGGIIYVILYVLEVKEYISMPVTIGIIICIRYYSIKHKLNLPNYKNKLRGIKNV